MKILCVSFDDEIDYLAPNPEELLAGHSVTHVSSLSEAVQLIQDGTRGTPPFDVILTDSIMPESELRMEQVLIAVRLVTLVYMKRIPGLGIFVPSCPTIIKHFNYSRAIVIRSDCRTPADKRDWEKLFIEVCNETKKIRNFA